MIVPMIDQALAQARLLIGADPKQGGVRPPERAKYEDRGRSFSRVPAREWRRLLNEALPRVGLVLVTETEALAGDVLTVTFSLTHTCGDTRTLTRAEPLPPAKSRSMGKQWAHTRAVNAIARTLLWQWDDEDEAADDAEDDAEKVQREDRAPRPRGQRPTKASRALNTLAGHLTGQVGEPAIELGQAEQEQEEQRAQEAERQAEERAAESPAEPVADPDWLEETIPHRAALEERLRAELERTHDQIQTREAVTNDAASPAPGALPGAALSKVDADVLSNETSTTGAEEVSAPAPSNTDPSPALPDLPQAVACEESSPAPERVSPGQGVSPEDAERVHGFGSPEHRARIRAKAEEYGDPFCEVHSWFLVGDALDEGIAPWCTECTDKRRAGAPEDETPHALTEEPEHRCPRCNETTVDTEGEVCGLCVTTEARCAECDLPLAADSTECPDPACPSNERQGTTAEALEALVGDNAVRCVSCEEPISGEPADEEDGGPLCSKCAGPIREPSPSQVEVVGQVAARVEQRHQGHEGTTHYEGDDCPSVGASEDSGPAPDPLAEFSGRRAMTAKENAKPVKCALCKSEIAPLAKYYAGSSRSRRAHVGCVGSAEQGRKPRKVGT